MTNYYQKSLKYQKKYNRLRQLMQSGGHDDIIYLEEMDRIETEINRLFRNRMQPDVDLRIRDLLLEFVVIMLQLYLKINIPLNQMRRQQFIDENRLIIDTNNYKCIIEFNPPSAGRIYDVSATIKSLDDEYYGKCFVLISRHGELIIGRDIVELRANDNN